MNEQIRAIQTSMSKEVETCFTDEDVAALNAVIRICLEVSDDLTRQCANLHSGQDFRYTLETVISGLEFFTCVANAYNVLVDARSSELDWSAIRYVDLKNTILAARDRFVSESDFLKKCRDLLDLYKLQLALVAASYE